MMSWSLLLLFAAADWDPKLAAQYLDGRQKEWLSYKPAQGPGGTCTPCHGSLLYAMARPALRKRLGESGSSNALELEISNGYRTRLEHPEMGSMFAGDKQEPKPSVEAVLAAFLTPGDERALDRLTALQLRDDGPDKGSWKWFNLNLEPWEGPASKFFGATLGAMALQSAPAAYRKRPEPARALRDVNEYLRRNETSQPLHHRLLLLWSRDPAFRKARTAILAEAWKQQQADGSWSNESLGPWPKKLHDSSADYATAFTAYSLLRSGAVSRKDPRLQRTLAWLASRQDRQKGHWSAQSMNKQRTPESMTGQFMNDSATAFAVLALLEADSR